MEDKLDELINSLVNNKKLLIISLIVYIIMMIFVIIMIWVPKEKDYGIFEKVDLNVKKQEVAQEYVNEIARMFKVSDKEGIRNLISTNYLEYTDKNIEDVMTEIASYFSIQTFLKGVIVYEDTDTYIYTSTIYSGNNFRKINIIETYPYEYKIAFDDFYSYEQRDNIVTASGITFNVENEYRNLNFVEYDISIKNTNDVNAYVNIGSIAGVKIFLEDSTNYMLKNEASTEEYTTIKPGETIRTTLSFAVPAQLQNSIESLVFYNVKISPETRDIRVTL